MKIILLIAFLGLGYSTYGGYIDYHNAVNEGEFHMYEGNYDLAISNFEMAFEMVNLPYARDFYLASKCYAQMNEPDLMYSYLEKSIFNGLNIDFVLTDSLWFTDFIFENEFKNALLIKPKSLEKISTKDSIYHEQLHLLYDELKHYSSAYMDNIISGDRDSLKLDSIRQLEQSFLLKNHDNFINLFSNHGIPIHPTALSHFETLCFQFVQFQDDNEIIELLRQALDQGKIKPIFFARLIEGQFLKLSKSKDRDYQYGLRSNTIEAKNLGKIQNQRKSIGLSIYFAFSPNYEKNYKPEPISENFKTTTISSSSN